MSFRFTPTTTRDTEFFWNAVAEHRLVVQRCTGCGELRHPPRPMCPRCNALSWDTIESTGRGTVFSVVTPRHPVYPWFDDPYFVAVIELEEGIRLVSNLVGVTAEQAAIGLEVEVCFERFDGDVVLPLFRPVTAP